MKALEEKVENLIIGEFEKSQEVKDFYRDYDDELYDFDYFVLFEKEQDVYDFYRRIFGNRHWYVHMMKDQVKDLVKEGEDLWVEFLFDIWKRKE